MPSIDVEKTGSNIKKITTDKHMTVKEVAEYLGFASPYPVYKWINDYFAVGAPERNIVPLRRISLANPRFAFELHHVIVKPCF